MPPAEDTSDLFTLEEVAKKLRVHKRTLRRLIEEGKFPRPLHPTPGAAMWTAEDLATYRAWVALAPRLRASRTPLPDDDDEPAPKPDRSKRKPSDRRGTIEGQE